MWGQKNENKQKEAEFVQSLGDFWPQKGLYLIALLKTLCLKLGIFVR